MEINTVASKSTTNKKKIKKIITHVDEIVQKLPEVLHNKVL